MESHVQLISIPLKSGDNMEKLRRKILRIIQKNEKGNLQGNNLKTVEGIDPAMVKSVTKNSQYFVFLLNDGRVCRMACSSHSQLKDHHISHEITRQARDTSLQVLSDAEYARQLQAQFDQERVGGDRFMSRSNIAAGDISPYVSLSYAPSLNSNFTSYSPSSPIYIPHSDSVGGTSSDRATGSGGADAGTGDGRSEAGDKKTKKDKEGIWPNMGPVEWLIVKQNPDSHASDSRFSMVATLHSEILLVGAGTGRLYSWPCRKDIVNPKPHPLEEELGLTDKKIVKICSSEVRCSLVTECGGIATFYDSFTRGCSEVGVPPLVASLSHSVTNFSEMSITDTVTDVFVSDFITSVITQAGRVYWWGLCPQGKASVPSGGHSNASSHATIEEGCLVRLKNGPPCGPNALVLQCSKTHGPRIGKTVNIMEHSSLDPVTSILVRVMKNTPSFKEALDESNPFDDSKLYESVEVWKHSDVIFLDDSPAVLGRVVAVDTNQAIVDISQTQQGKPSTSGAGDSGKGKSSLKVFRVTELETCVSTDFNASALEKSGTDIRSSAAFATKRSSRHVAGVVQHLPICLIDPHQTFQRASSQTMSPEDSLEGLPAHAPLAGYEPVTMHMTNEGPFILVRSVKDGQGYVIASAHSTSGLIQTSSYVSLSGRDQKPPHCTVPEEGCDCVETALMIQRDSNPHQQQQDGPALRSKGKGRKRKLTHRDSDGAILDLPKSEHAFFVNLYDSEIFCLRDINGILIPIPPGLKLRPVEHQCPDWLGGWSPMGQGKQLKLNNPYKCIVSNQYTIEEGGKKTLLLITVPQSTSLISSVIMGDYEEVERQLKILTSKYGSVSSAVSDSEEIQPKKSNVFNNEASPDEPCENGGSMDTTEPPSLPEGADQPDPLSNMNIDADAVWDRDESADVGLSLASLYECSAQNCNILHACAGSDGVEVEDDKSAFVGYVADSLRYQSITIQPEYRHLSFEELRFASKGKQQRSKKEPKKEGEDLNQAHYLILELFLSCETFRNDVTKLLCQRNAYGETPFMCAIAHLNMASALKIFRFVQEKCPDIFEKAILPRNREGLTPIQMLIASFSTCFDVLNMKLYISSMPVGYTAQQLLTLFKEFYPSAYRAEVTKDTEIDDSAPQEADESSEEETDSEAEDQGTFLTPLANNQSNTGRRPGQRNGASDANVPLRGVVYFGDIHQLRAAHLEMQDFRVFSNYNSRGGGSFGQTHSVSFLNVGLEPNEVSEIEGDSEGGGSSVLDGGLMSRIGQGRRMGLRSGGWGSSGRNLVNEEMREENRKKKACSCLSYACRLLCEFFRDHRLCGPQDINGETIINTLAHNPRTIQAHKDVSVPYVPPPPSPDPKKESSSSDIKPEIAIAVDKPLEAVTSSTATDVATTLSSLLSGTNTTLGTTGLGIFGTQLTSSSSTSSSIIPPLKLLDSTASATPPLKSPLWRPFGPPVLQSEDAQELNLTADGTTDDANKPGPDQQPMDSDTITTPDVEPMVEDSDKAKKVTFAVDSSPVTEKVTFGVNSSSKMEESNEKSEEDTKSQETNSNDKSPDKQQSASSLEEQPSSPSGTEEKPSNDDKTETEEEKSTEDKSTDEKPDSPLSSYMKDCCPSCGLYTHDDILGYDMLRAIFRNWQCICTSILGFNPFPYIESKQPFPAPSSVKTLDNFVTNMIVNCDSGLIVGITGTTTTEMNNCLDKGIDIRPVLDADDDLEGMNESNLSLYVGVRFIRSIVRALMLEHSRVKSSVAEVQLSREGRNRSSQLQMRSKIVQQILKNTITSFSWLSVEIIAKAAEVAIAPVRLGVSKPFGASSVTNEYQPSRLPSSLRFAADRNSGMRSLARQLHIRSALPTQDMPPGTLPTSNGGISVLPVTGLKLVAQQRSSGGTKDDDNDGGEHDDFGMDLSDSDMQISEQNESFEATPRVDNIRMDFAEGSSSDEDDPFDMIGMGGRRGANDRDGDPLGEVYPYAWALDGRRIGENTPVVRPSSPTSSFFGHGEITTPLSTIPSIRFGAGFLARTFARAVKDLVDIIIQIVTKQAMTSTIVTKYFLYLPPEVASTLLQSTVETLDRTWVWLTDILDVAEGQLREGKKFDTSRYVSTLRGSARPSSPTHGSSVVQRIITRTASKSFIGSTPGEYMTYLLRSHTGKEDGCLPVMDLYGYEHVVYALDGLLYTLTYWPQDATDICKLQELSTSPSKAEEVDSIKKKYGLETDEPKNIKFFLRSESIRAKEEVEKSNEQFFATASSPGPSHDPYHEAFPFAKQPHLLQAFTSKDQLFGSPRSNLEADSNASGTGADTSGTVTNGAHEEEKMEDDSVESQLVISYSHLGKRKIKQPVTVSWSLEDALQRWNISVSVFAHIFLAEGPGGERNNFLNNRAGFASRMARFRHQVSQLFESIQNGRNDWTSVSNTLSIRVRRDHLLEDSLEFLGHMTKFHYTQVRVKFEDEDGSGPGVNRGFFASLANAIRQSDITKPPCNKIGTLFYQPGKEPEQSGVYSPRPFIPPASNSAAKNSAISAQRRLVFRAIGRFLGLCFWFKHTIPFMVCRHVAKYLLDRELGWHDLAFFNADLYEGLRRMMMDAKSEKTKDDFQATYCCYFEAPIAGQKLTGKTTEPVFKDLIKDGSKVAVTPDRVQEYVRLYSMFVMVGCVRDELLAMRSGLTDIIPPELLEGLTAEDFQLLLSGDAASISLQRLKSVMKFNHTHGRTQGICDRFEKMFWRVVGHMNNTQRQQLLYFATGSASLPSSSDEEQSPVSITIDVIGGSNIEALPVASTCSQRLSIPLYPSYHILKKKLMQAIQCQAYGLG